MKKNKKKDAIFRWTFVFMRPFFIPIACISLISLIGNYIGTYEPLLTGKIIDTLTTKNVTAFWNILGIIVGIQLLSLIFSLASSWGQYLLQKKMSLYTETRLFLNILHLSPYASATSNHGKILNIFLNDLAQMSGIYSHQIPSLGITFCTMCIIGSRLFKIDSFFFILTIIFSIVPVFLANYFGKKQAIITDFQRKQQDEYTTFIQETIDGLHEIKNYSATKFFKKKFNGILNEIFIYLKKSTFLTMRSSSASFAAHFVTSISLFIIVGYSVLKGKNTVGTIVSALMYSQNFRSLVSSSAETYKNVIVSFISAKRLKECFDSRNNRGNIISTCIPATKKAIYLKNITFSYDTNRPLFVDFNTTFYFPNLYLIQGANGSGKTTLLNILSGSILGEKSKGVSKGTIELLGFESKNISYVSQTPYIFSATILENITFGKPVDNTIIEEILQKTHLEQVINHLPNGMDTKLGGTGHVLSQGQYQRLALARCLLQKTDIILFDEAENNLDIKSTQALFTTLKELKNEKLIIMVTHRHDYDCIADYIITL